MTKYQPRIGMKMMTIWPDGKWDPGIGKFLEFQEKKKRNPLLINTYKPKLMVFI